MNKAIRRDDENTFLHVDCYAIWLCNIIMFNNH